MTALRHALPELDPKASQRAASDPAVSVWVNASAGSGKTKVLTARVIRLLLSGVPPEKILCLTYTRAGAAEMANRVTATLSKWAVCSDVDLRADLDELQDKPPTKDQPVQARRLFARILSCAGGMRIRTIHSFCQEILSRFPLEAGLPPHFALLDEHEMKTLRTEVLDDLLRECAQNPASEAATALDVLISEQGEFGITKMLQEIILARGRFAEARVQFGSDTHLLARVHAMLGLAPDQGVEDFKASFMSNLPLRLRDLAGWLAEGSKTHKERSAEILAVMDEPLAKRVGRFQDYCLVFLTRENQPRKAFADQKTLQRFPEIQEISQNECVRLITVLERIEAAEIARVTKGALIFGGAFSDRLSVRKAQRAALDYDDLILMTENLLRRDGIAPWILYKLDNGLDHILVDEAQDTSVSQWNIVEALTAEFFAGKGAREGAKRTLFVVGDEKQSIFSFQNASPDAFLRKRSFFSKQLDQSGDKLEKIGLNTSFRSAPAVLRAVDQIFSPETVRRGVSSDPVIHSSYRNRDGTDKAGRVELWPLLRQNTDARVDLGEWIVPTGYEDEHDPQAELALQIATKIKSWIKSGVVLAGHNAPIAPGDIMILLRRRGRFADLMVRALKAAGVPVTGVDRMRLIAQLPVMDLLALVRFVLLPEDDLNLGELLRSPLIGLSEDELMELAIGRTGTLWQSLKGSRKFDAVRAYLDTRLSEADFTTPFSFLSVTLNSSCPGSKTSGRNALWARLGDECLDPIDELLNEAEKYGATHTPSLQSFVHWLAQSNTEIKRELDRSGGQVRIMTVHAAKGLEAPIVFLPDTVSVPRTTDMQRLQWSGDQIPLYLARHPQYGAAYELWQNAHLRQMEEYRRLFYVALTRAANRLYICGWLDGKNDEAPPESWYHLAATALVSDYEDAASESEYPTPSITIADLPAAQVTPNTVLPSESAATALPDWVTTEGQASEPLQLSAGRNEDTAATPDSAFSRGRIIHRLLQSIPDVAPARREALVQRFLEHPRHDLSTDQQSDIAQEVMVLLRDERFEALFGPDSLAEAPLTGQIGRIPIFRQIDRLVLRDNEVWIVDYKTNRPPPADERDIPHPYRRQLDEYRQLLGSIYPSRTIRSFLLWTYAPRLMEIHF